MGKKNKKPKDKAAYNKRQKSSKKITPIPWKKFEKFLFHVGCEFISQEKTSHRKYRKPGLIRPVIIPVHTKELVPFLIQNNLKTESDFNTACSVNSLPTEPLSPYASDLKPSVASKNV